MKKNFSVCILLSTYNGEKYLEALLQSIFNQTYWNCCTLFVRDDGSTDKTVNILKKYESVGKITLVCGDNLGFVKSFFWLMKNAPESDYYAFADQDDIWKNNKIEHGLSVIKNENQEQPLLYFSDYAIIDADGELLNEHYTSQKLHPSFFTSMTYNQASGFTMLLNKKLKNSLVIITPKKGQYHDYWVYLYANAFGKILYDNFICAYYRRHGNNESETTIKGFNLFKKRFKHFFVKGLGNANETTLNDFRKYFYNDLSEENKKIIDLFCSKINLKSSLLKVFYSKRYRPSLLDEICIRI